MGFLDKLIRRSSANESAIPDFHPVIDKICEIMGYDVRKSRGDYESRLLPALNAAIQSLDTTIASIPGPFDMSATAHAQNPLLRVLFPSADSINHAIGRSMEVRQSFTPIVNAGHGEAYGLLGTRCRPEEQVAGKAPVFADHTLRSLSHHPDLVRVSLREAALSRIVLAFGEHIEKLQKKGKLPRTEWAMNGTPAPAAFGQDDFVYAGQELLPENMLQGLIDWLSEPSRHLNIQPRGFRVSIRQGDSSPAEEFIFPTMNTADRRHWLVCLVRFPTAEAQTALKNETKVHRYIFV